MEYDLERFVKAQTGTYDRAYKEMAEGQKRSHWIWYIYPQQKGLGHSYNSQHYGLQGAGEAAEYLAHPILGTRLREITKVLLTHKGRKTAREIMGSNIDTLKLKTSMELFDEVSPNDVFREVLDAFFSTGHDKPVLGAIIGDVAGSTYEFHNVKATDFEMFPYGSKPTDDSVMTLAVAKWLMTDKAHTMQTLTRIMQTLGRKYPDAGYGRHFIEWLHEEAPEPYNSWGNGSGMRVSPIGLYAKTIDEAMRLAKISAKVSHNHPEGIKGAQAIACGMVMFRQGRSKEEIRRFIEERFGYDLGRSIGEIRPTYTFDVSCQGSVPVAITAFLEGNSFEEVIRLAISVGGDSDTIGAMAGALASCRYPIPKEITGKTRQRMPEELLGINDEFISFLQTGKEETENNAPRNRSLFGHNFRIPNF